MNCIFKSVFKEELASFMDFIKLSVTDWKTYQCTLLSIDSYLHTQGLRERRIDAQQVKRWLDGSNVGLSTKKNKLSHIRKFSIYLSTLGIKASLPELPRRTREFKPYVYSKDEITHIFEAVDDYTLTNRNSPIAAELPVFVRILYGCGLRSDEAQSLTWDDIDLSAGVITVKIAKNRKQRFVPMGGELTRILNLYRKSPGFDAQDHGFLFRKNNGERRYKSIYRCIFNKILCGLGIRNHRNTKYGSRGPCLHSLRHTFTLHSILKAASEGRGFMETVPFLSTYLGHKGLMETDKYLRAKHELYTEAHTVIADYIRDVFPQDV